MRCCLCGLPTGDFTAAALNDSRYCAECAIDEVYDGDERPDEPFNDQRNYVELDALREGTWLQRPQNFYMDMATQTTYLDRPITLNTGDTYTYDQIITHD